MTNRQVVSRLRELGYQVEVYVRKDGSIRVTRINGEKFSSRLSVGVNRAREILFSHKDYVPPREAERRAAIISQRAQARASRASGNTLRSQSKQFQAEYKKLRNLVKRIREKLRREGKFAKFKLPSWQSIKEISRKVGISPFQQVSRASDYYSAIYSYVAPETMIQTGIAKIEAYSLQYENQDKNLYKLYNFLKSHLHTKDIDINEMKITLNFIYDFAKGVYTGSKASESESERIQRLEATLHH